jgi:hypothetical protein
MDNYKNKKFIHKTKCYFKEYLLLINNSGLILISIYIIKQLYTKVTLYSRYLTKVSIKFKLVIQRRV